MKEKRHLLKVRRSRKAYFLLYLMIFSVLFLIGYLNYKNYEISKFALIISIVFVVLMIKIIEVHRFRDWWAITNTSLIQSTGIFDKNIREIDFSSISDLDLDQPFFKRILDYGIVNVRLFLNETSIKIMDINKPEEFIRELQNKISINRKQKNGLRKI